MTKPPRKPPGLTPLPVMIRGEEYASATIAAKHFGIHPSVVYTMLNRGRADLIGLGKGGARCRKTICKPVTIAGVTYPSRVAASAALGFSKKHISNFLLADPDMQARMLPRILAAAMRLAAKTETKALKETTRETGLRPDADDRRLCA